MLQDAGFDLPAELRAAAEFTVGRRFEAELQRLEREPSHDTLRAALLIADEVARLGYRLDRARTRRRVERLIARAVSSCVESHEAENFEAAFELIRLAHALGLDADIERAQEIVYEAVRREPARGGMRGLALVLHLSPRLFERDDALERENIGEPTSA
jgi:hypothetical protein